MSALTTIFGGRPTPALWAATLILLAGLTYAILALPVAYQLFAAFGLTMIALFFARPRPSLLALFAGEILIGMLWWVQDTLLGLNLMEAYSGMATALLIGQVALLFRRAERHPLFLAIVVFAGVLAIAAARAPDAESGIGEFIRYVSPYALLLAVAHLYGTRGSQGRALGVIAAIGLVPLAVSAYYLAAGQLAELEAGGVHRLRGGYTDISSQGQTMACFAALAVLATSLLRNWHRVAALAYVAGTLTCVYLSHSRTAQVGIAAFVVAYLVLERRFLLLGVALAVGVALVTTNLTLQGRFDDLLLFFTMDPIEGQGAIDDLGSGRIRIWRLSLESFSQKTPLDWVLGVGLENHRALYLEHHAPGKSSHNDYLTLFFQAGPVALTLYLFMATRVARLAQRVRATATGWERHFANYVLAMVAMVLVMNFFSNAFVSRIATSWVFWGAAGLLYAVAERMSAEASASAAAAR